MTDAREERGNFDEGHGPPGVEQVSGPGRTGVTMPLRFSHSTGPMAKNEPAGQAVLLLGSDTVPPTRWAYGTHSPTAWSAGAWK